MIAKDQNTALLIVGKAAQVNPDWADYASYCLDREKGLRKEAFRHLDSFLAAAMPWPADKKIAFIRFLFPFFESVPEADYGPFPQPLSDRLIKPALQQWCEVETVDNNPFRWYGKYYRSEQHLFRALELSPADDLARQAILLWWTDAINYSVHHLPEYYIGDPYEDGRLGGKINEQIQRLAVPELREYWTNRLEKDLELVRNYIAWKTSGHPDLEKWGQENNKRVSSDANDAYYYEK